MTVKEACLDKTFCMHILNRRPTLKKNHNYYQCLGVMAICQLPFLDFIVYTEADMSNDISNGIIKTGWHTTSNTFTTVIRHSDSTLNIFGMTLTIYLKYFPTTRRKPNLCKGSQNNWDLFETTEKKRQLKVPRQCLQ